MDRTAAALAQTHRRTGGKRDRGGPRGHRQGTLHRRWRVQPAQQGIRRRARGHPCRHQRRHVEEDCLMTATTDIVAKLWALCHVLRDDGVTYNEYVTELTYLLFLKMLSEVQDQNGHLRENRLPEAWRWGILAKKEGMDQLDYYK